MPEWLGKTIGKVRIEKYLSRGGMAAVYLGTHLTLDRSVAVKVLHGFIEEDPDLRARFQREAKVVAALRHPNIVQIYDFDVADEHPYIVMEYLAGPALSAYLRSMHKRAGRLPFLQVNHLLAQIASALDYAHSTGVIHRDVKPANILLHQRAGTISLEEPLPNDVEPILTDFGLVRIAHATTHTTTGTVSGTPAYMSPEQARGDRVDSRTDVYSLGVVLYEILAGRVPFEGDSTAAVLFKHINEPPPPISGLPSALHSVVERALSKNPDDRYQTCRDLAAAFLEAIGLNAQAETVRDGALALSPRSGNSKAPAVVEKREQTKGPARKRWLRTAAIGLVLCVVCGLGLSVLSQANTPTPTLSPELTEPPTDVPTDVPISFPPIPDGVPVGALTFQDLNAAADQVTLSATLMPPPEGTQYEAWLVGDGGELRRSIGVLALDDLGQTQLVFADPQGRMLFYRFDSLEITLEPNPDDNPNPTAQIIYSSALPPEALGQIRGMLVTAPETPNSISLALGLNYAGNLIMQSGDAMLAAYEAGDEAGLRAQAEAIINLIVGNQRSDMYGDWDGDGSNTDPGDGYGLLQNGEQTGYIGAIYAQLDPIVAAPDATAEIKLHAEAIRISTQNLETWSGQLLDAASQILQSAFDENLDPTVRAARSLAYQMYFGTDLDSSGAVDTLPDESGAYLVYQHSYALADMLIYPGANQMSPPAQ